MCTNNKTKSELLYDAIAVELDRRFREAGYGTKKHVLQALGLGEGYLASTNRRRALKLKVLIEIAQELNVGLPEIILAAERPFRDEMVEPPLGEAPSVVARVLGEAREAK